MFISRSSDLSFVFFFKQKTAYEMRISDWSSDVCSSDLIFERWLARWRGEGLAPVRERWATRAHPRGTALTARLPDGSAIEGLFERLDADGALVLRLAAGTMRVIHAGDVFLI